MFTTNIYSKLNLDVPIKELPSNNIDRAKNIAINYVEGNTDLKAVVIDGNDVVLYEYIGKSDGYCCRNLLP